MFFVLICINHAFWGAIWPTEKRIGSPVRQDARMRRPTKLFQGSLIGWCINMEVSIPITPKSPPSRPLHC